MRASKDAPLEERVRVMVVEQLGLTNAPQATDRLVEDLGADDLDNVELVMALEEEFGIPIPDEEAVKLKTPGDIVAYLEKAAPVTIASIFQMRLVRAESSAETELLRPIPSLQDRTRPEPLPVEKRVLLDQTAVKRAGVMTDLYGLPQIDIEFTAAGSKAFAAITRTNVNQRLAMVMEGRLYTAPQIMQEITDGRAMITGNFSIEEARALARKINEQLKQ